MSLQPEHTECIELVLHPNVEQAIVVREHDSFVQWHSQPVDGPQLQALLHEWKLVQVTSAVNDGVEVTLRTVLEAKGCEVGC